ncbi:MAG TPA: adenylate/guanylate cyclase domain-containing protein [Solirubrobacteraceae bacterium]|nr:adenylate/guanylate cyclase domain-containing protein [Solirubrobacteraceae bacterium]
MSETASCPACGAQTDAAQRFCGGCGRALQRACPACGQENPQGFQFCGACGAVLGAEEPATAPASDADEERRWATVLFADLSGFTALSERTDPEEIRSMVDRCMCAMGEVVERFGGAVDKVIGDALMAVFGAPVAHEDDPKRAVRAALEIQRRASENAEEFCGLCVRVGVNSGEVIFARVGPEARRELTVMGDAVNTAARLQAAAPAEGVLVGEETHAATADDIQYEALAPVHAKGKAVPLQAWLARSAAAAPRERRVSSTPFVGRDTELELIARAWARTSSEHHPQLVTVVGAPGIGKTRLALELAGRIQEDGGRTLRGRSLPYGERDAYGAFAQIVKEMCGIFASDPSGAAQGKLAHTVGHLLAGEEAANVATHLAIVSRLTEAEVEERDDLFDSVRRFLDAVAQQQPTLLVLEDLHWADQSLLELVSSLVLRLADAPLLILALARSEFLDDQPNWARLPGNLTVQLDALGSAHVDDLVRLLLPRASEEESIVRRVERAAGGNPLLIEELTAWLSEDGASEAAELPTNVKTMIAARLDRLPGPERQLILSASVIGDVFWRGSLEALEVPGPLSELLHSLELRDLIRRMPESRIEGDQELSFKHGLIREVAYSTLPMSARRERHAAVARFVEGAAGDRSAYAASLAHHWRCAGDGARAADYLLTAADQAGRGWAQHEAVDLCNQALELVPHGDEARRRRVRLRRAVALQARLHAEGDITPGDQSKSSGEMSPPIS